MENEHCVQDGRISSMETKINSLDEIINKNGIRDAVIRLDEKYNSLDENTRNIAKSISALVRFQTEIKTEKKVQDKSGNKIKWLIGIIITLLIFIAGIILEQKI